MLQLIVGGGETEHLQASDASVSLYVTAGSKSMAAWPYKHTCPCTEEGLFSNILVAQIKPLKRCSQCMLTSLIETVLSVKDMKHFGCLLRTFPLGQLFTLSGNVVLLYTNIQVYRTEHHWPGLTHSGSSGSTMFKITSANLIHASVSFR